MDVRVSLMTVLILLIGIGGCTSADEGWTGPDSDSSPDSYPGGTDDPSLIGGGYGWIQVDSVPQGAFVEVDGTGQGTTPVSVQVSSTGTPSHRIRVTHPGYQEWTGHVSGNPAPGETISQTAYLVPVTVDPTPEPTITVLPTPIGGDSGWFKIESNPSGADVTFDSSYQGTTPVLVRVLVTATPSHDLKIRKNGYQEYFQRITYNPGRDETIPITASLVPLSPEGSITVTSDPSGAFATLDAGQQYLTPFSFPQVVTGMHTITVSKDGYVTYTTRVQVEQDSHPRVHASLSRTQVTGTLDLHSVPEGADVKIDNLWQGQTPQRIGNLAAGTHTLSLRLAGYQTVTREVMISSGQETRVHQVLEKVSPEARTGSLMVSTTPAGASVYLNGDYQGTTPVSGALDLTDLDPGIYTLLLTAQHREDLSTPVTVAAGRITPVNVELKPASTPAGMNGTLSISSVPAGAQILLDNRFIGYTPVILSSVGPGEYSLVLKMAGYGDYSNRVQIAAGMTTTASINLTPAAPVSPTPAPSPAEPAARSPLPLFLVPAGLAGALLLYRSGRQD